MALAIPRKLLTVRALASLLVMLMAVVLACNNSGGQAPIEAPVATAKPAAKINTIASVPSPLPLKPSSSSETVLAEDQFVHNGFREQATGDLDVSEVQFTGEASELVVSISNLSAPTGDLSTRATINFSDSFDNYVDVLTESGTKRFYIHRDGTLRSEPDNGSFT